MTSNGAPPTAPHAVRRLEGPAPAALADLVETFEELQTVLRCCERLVAEVAADEPDAVLVEALWTMALLSYGRCFSAGAGDSALTEADLTAAQPAGEVVEWHRMLLLLRDHQTDPATNPRERFSIGVTQDADGTASGVAITSVRQPLVDGLTVRQTGAIAYALSSLVNGRIESEQEQVFAELKSTTKEELDELEPLEVTPPSVAP